MVRVVLLCREKVELCVWEGEKEGGRESGSEREKKRERERVSVYTSGVTEVACAAFLWAPIVSTGASRFSRILAIFSNCCLHNGGSHPSSSSSSFLTRLRPFVDFPLPGELLLFFPSSPALNPKSSIDSDILTPARFPNVSPDSTGGPLARPQGGKKGGSLSPSTDKVGSRSEEVSSGAVSPRKEGSLWRGGGGWPLTVGGRWELVAL